MLGVALEFKDYPDTTTPYTATNMNNMKKLLVDLIYPIGCYFETSDGDFDPNVKWGGTWVLETDGTVLVSKSSTAGSKFNDDIGTVVGEEEHTLTVDESPEHNHGMLVEGQGGSSSYALRVLSTGAGGGFNTMYSNINGGGQAHNNVQPSKIINRWHRTA